MVLVVSEGRETYSLIDLSKHVFESDLLAFVKHVAIVFGPGEFTTPVFNVVVDK